MCLVPTSLSFVVLVSPTSTSTTPLSIFSVSDECFLVATVLAYEGPWTVEFPANKFQDIITMVFFLLSGVIDPVVDGCRPFIVDAKLQTEIEQVSEGSS